MQKTVGHICQHATQLLAHQLSPMIELHHGMRLLQHPADPLSETQLRSCLAALQVAYAVQMGIMTVMRSGHHRVDRILRFLLRSSAKEELEIFRRQVGIFSKMQLELFFALKVAPADVVGRCRLTARGDGLLSAQLGRGAAGGAAHSRRPAAAAG